MGIAVGTVRAYFNDPDMAKQHARRKAYSGVCEVCGAATHGDAPGKASVRCPKHQRRAGAYWTPERLILAIQQWVLTYGEVPTMLDWNGHEANARGYPEKARRFYRLRKSKSIPWFTAVVRAFGSWNAGIEAAGYTPRPNHGTTDTRDTARARRALALEHDRENGVVLTEVFKRKTLAR